MKLGKYKSNSRSRPKKTIPKTVKYEDDGVLPVADFALLPETNTQNQINTNTNINTVPINTNTITIPQEQTDNRKQQLQTQKHKKIKKEMQYLQSNIIRFREIIQSIQYRIQDANEELISLKSDVTYLKQELLEE